MTRGRGQTTPQLSRSHCAGRVTPETDTHAKEHDGTSCYLRVGGLPVHDADAGQKQKGDRNDRDHRTVEAVEDDCRRPSDEKGERNGEQLLLLAVIGPASFSD